MSADYAISVRARLECVIAEASRLAECRCLFWWKPEPDDWHRFVFTNHDVIILFLAYLRRDIVGEDDKRIKFSLALSGFSGIDSGRLSAWGCPPNQHHCCDHGRR